MKLMIRIIFLSLFCAACSNADHADIDLAARERVHAVALQVGQPDTFATTRVLVLNDELRFDSFGGPLQVEELATGLIELRGPLHSTRIAALFMMCSEALGATIVEDLGDFGRISLSAHIKGKRLLSISFNKFRSAINVDGQWYEVERVKLERILIELRSLVEAELQTIAAKAE